MAKSNTLPSISIITPSYNQAAFIKETVDSVLAQNYPNLEYWVIDGASTDETVAILKSYGSKINWVSEKDRGQTHAINKGLKKTSGEIVAYLNSDDVLLPNTLHTVAEYFLSHPEAEWLTGDYFIIDEQGRKMQSWIAWYKILLRQHPQLSTLFIANYIAQPSTFWRRSVMKKTGWFNESLRYCMDYEYWVRLFAQTQLHVVPRHFSLFRIHGQSKGGRLFAAQFKEEHEVVKRFCKNPVVRWLHWWHATLIVLVYQWLKS